jgi:hypothetical protein
MDAYDDEDEGGRLLFHSSSCLLIQSDQVSWGDWWILNLWLC